jgi:hypothetical protein
MIGDIMSNLSNFPILILDDSIKKYLNYYIIERFLKLNNRSIISNKTSISDLQGD